jgi:hypothetical protein
MTTEQMDEKDEARTGRGRWPLTPNPADRAAPLTISTDDFDPPLTMGQAEQMQDFINQGIVASGWVAPHNRLNPDEPAPDLDPEQHFGHEPYWVERTTDAITDTTQFSEDTLFKVDAALFEAGINGVNARRDLISAMQNAGILFRERVTDAEEHTHYTREARDQCAAGDHQYAVLLDGAAEREKRAADDWEIRSATTMAAEPPEHRDRRQWLDGYLYGFREGFERAGWVRPS